MTTKTHCVTPEELMALHDGELHGDLAREVEVHANECADCGRLLDELRQIARETGSWEIEALSPKVEAAVMEVARITSAARTEGVPRKHFRPRVVWALSAMAVVAMAVVAVVGTISRPTLYRSTFAEHAKAERLKSPEPERSADRYSDELVSPPPPPAPVVMPGLASKEAKAGSAGLVEAPMIARTVSLVVRVGDFDAARAALDGVLFRHHGYAAQLNANSPENSARTLTASLRVPASELAAAVIELKMLGRVENESQGGDEVTQQHADLAARLKNARETEMRLQAILQQRTGKVSDVLEVEEELARVRGEIESMQAQLEGLEHRVSFATIDLQLVEEYKAPLSSPSHSTATQLHNAFVAGYRNVANSLLGLLFFLLADGPAILFWVALLAAPGFLIWRRYRKNLARM